MRPPTQVPANTKELKDIGNLAILDRSFLAFHLLPYTPPPPVEKTLERPDKEVET